MELAAVLAVSNGPAIARDIFLRSYGELTAIKQSRYLDVYGFASKLLLHSKTWRPILSFQMNAY